MRTKYVFARKAKDLPQDPKLYKSGVAYKLEMSDDFIRSGYGANEFADTARLNKYLQDLTEVVITLFKYGVPTSNLSDLVDHAIGDLALFSENNHWILKIFDGQQWQDWAVFADGNTAGIILEKDCFKSEDPWNLIPVTASHDNYGPSVKDDFVLNTDLIRCCSASMHRSNQKSYFLSKGNSGRFRFFLGENPQVTVDKSEKGYPMFSLNFSENNTLEIKGLMKITDAPRNLYTLPDGTWCPAVEE